MWMGLLLGLLLAQTPGFEQAVALHRSGKLAEAEKAYRGIVSSGKANAEVLANLGAVLAQRENYAEAIVMYQRALRLDPRLTPLHLNLGLAFFKSGNFTAALPEFDHFLASQPTHRQALQLRATCLAQMERFPDAVTAYEKLLPTDDISIRLGYATALLRTQRTTEARRILEPLMSGEQSPEFQMTVGQANFAEGLYDEAEEIFARLYAQKPDLPLLRLSLGSVYWKKRRTEDAIRLWEEEATRLPQSFEANYTLGAALALNEAERSRAEVLLRKSVQLRPRSARANYQLAKLLSAAGKPAEARGLLTTATAADPKYREAHYLLAMVCQKLGRAEEARREFAIVQQLAKQDLERQNDLFDEAKP